MCAKKLVWLKERKEIPLKVVNRSKISDKDRRLYESKNIMLSKTNLDEIFLEGEVAEFGTLENHSENENDRWYTKEPYLEEVDRLQPIILGRRLFGALDHDDDYAVKMKEVSHMITELYFCEDRQRVIIRIKLIPTVIGGGMDAIAIVNAGGNLSISARAIGYYDEETHEAVMDTIFTYDIVDTPGMAFATLNIVETRDNLLIADVSEADKSIINRLLSQKKIKTLNENKMTEPIKNEDLFEIPVVKDGVEASVVFDYNEEAEETPIVLVKVIKGNEVIDPSVMTGQEFLDYAELVEAGLLTSDLFENKKVGRRLTGISQRLYEAKKRYQKRVKFNESSTPELSTHKLQGVGGDIDKYYRKTKDGIWLEHSQEKGWVGSHDDVKEESLTKLDESKEETNKVKIEYFSDDKFLRSENTTMSLAKINGDKFKSEDNKNDYKLTPLNESDDTSSSLQEIKAFMATCDDDGCSQKECWEKTCEKFNLLERELRDILQTNDLNESIEPDKHSEELEEFIEAFEENFASSLSQQKPIKYDVLREWFDESDNETGVSWEEFMSSISQHSNLFESTKFETTSELEGHYSEAKDQADAEYEWNMKLSNAENHDKSKALADKKFKAKHGVDYEATFTKLNEGKNIKKTKLNENFNCREFLDAQYCTNALRMLDKAYGDKIDMDDFSAGEGQEWMDAGEKIHSFIENGLLELTDDMVASPTELGKKHIEGKGEMMNENKMTKLNEVTTDGEAMAMLNDIDKSIAKRLFDDIIMTYGSIAEAQRQYEEDADAMVIKTLDVVGGYAGEPSFEPLFESKKRKLNEAKEVEFPNSNLYYKGFGVDTNGNKVIKIGFPNERGFSIQTNGNLRDTQSILEGNENPSDGDLAIIEKEVIDYIDQYGTETQKKRMKKYGALKESKRIKLNKSFEFEKFTGTSDSDALKMLSNFYGDDIDGEDFYPNLSKTHSQANDRINALTDAGYLEIDDDFILTFTDAGSKMMLDLNESKKQRLFENSSPELSGIIKWYDGGYTAYDLYDLDYFDKAVEQYEHEFSKKISDEGKMALLKHVNETNEKKNLNESSEPAYKEYTITDKEELIKFFNQGLVVEGVQGSDKFTEVESIEDIDNFDNFIVRFDNVDESKKMKLNENSENEAIFSSYKSIIKNSPEMSFGEICKEIGRLNRGFDAEYIEYTLKEYIEDDLNESKKLKLNEGASGDNEELKAFIASRPMMISNQKDAIWKVFNTMVNDGTSEEDTLKYIKQIVSLDDNLDESKKWKLNEATELKPNSTYLIKKGDMEAYCEFKKSENGINFFDNSGESVEIEDKDVDKFVSLDESKRIRRLNESTFRVFLKNSTVDIENFSEFCKSKGLNFQNDGGSEFVLSDIGIDDIFNMIKTGKNEGFWILNINDTRDGYSLNESKRRRGGLNENSDRVKLVVYNDHTLGYIEPDMPNNLGILHASVLRGATSGLNAMYQQINPNDIVRLATKQDFEDFRVHFGGYYDTDKYEYQKDNLNENSNPAMNEELEKLLNQYDGMQDYQKEAIIKVYDTLIKDGGTPEGALDYIKSSASYNGSPLNESKRRNLNESVRQILPTQKKLIDNIEFSIDSISKKVGTRLSSVVSSMNEARKLKKGNRAKAFGEKVIILNESKDVFKVQYEDGNEEDVPSSDVKPLVDNTVSAPDIETIFDEMKDNAIEAIREIEYSQEPIVVQMSDLKESVKKTIRKACRRLCESYGEAKQLSDEIIDEVGLSNGDFSLVGDISVPTTKEIVEEVNDLKVMVTSLIAQNEKLSEENARLIASSENVVSNATSKMSEMSEGYKKMFEDVETIKPYVVDHAIKNNSVDNAIETFITDKVEALKATTPCLGCLSDAQLTVWLNYPNKMSKDVIEEQLKACETEFCASDILALANVVDIDLATELSVV